MLVKLEQSQGSSLGFLASGRLTDNDYRNFLIPTVKGVLDDYPGINLLFEFEDFRGWDPQAMWQDFTFGMEINPRVRKLALVGDKAWEHWVARLVKTFTYGETRYFNLADRQAAWQWLLDNHR